MDVRYWLKLVFNRSKSYRLHLKCELADLIATHNIRTHIFRLIHLLALIRSQFHPRIMFNRAIVIIVYHIPLVRIKYPLLIRHRARIQLIHLPLLYTVCRVHRIALLYPL